MNRIVDFKRVRICPPKILKFCTAIIVLYFRHTFQSFTEPSSAKLLPDELPPPYQRPYTVVLELNDILIHTEYDVSNDIVFT